MTNQNHPFTQEEKQIMDLIVDAHNKFLQLKQTHPNEINEWINGIHYLQNVLGWRILRRDYPAEFITVN